MKRLNKEYILDFSNDIDVRFGSVNKDDPKVIYLSVSVGYHLNLKMIITIFLRQLKGTLNIPFQHSFLTTIIIQIGLF